MSKNDRHKDVAFRACIAALIVDENNRFLLTRLADAGKDSWDFVKGGMHAGESDEEALTREIKEELGESVECEVMEKSLLNIIYDWPEEMQKDRGFKGQARISYWVKYVSGDIEISERELAEYRWFDESEVESVLEKSGFPEFYIDTIVGEWQKLRKS